MKKLLVLFALLFVVIWAADIDGIYEFEVRKNLPFLEEGRTERLDLYLPVGTKGARAAVVMIHGGSWRGGSKSSPREINICQNLARMGFVAASIEYRLVKGDVPAWPVNLQDCKNAVKYLRSNAEKYQILPEKIGVIGSSAGGHLAVMLALTAKNLPFEPAAPYPGVSSEVACCINMYGPMSLRETQKTPKASFYKMLGCSYEGNEEKWKGAVPLEHIANAACPFLSVHGEADKVVSVQQAQILHDALTKQGSTSEILIVPGMGHQFSMEYTKNFEKLPPNVRQVMLSFLERNLKGYSAEEAEAHYQALLKAKPLPVPRPKAKAK